jgi:acetyltransferase-like isoleucine patch superfamily enzyme
MAFYHGRQGFKGSEGVLCRWPAGGFSEMFGDLMRQARVNKSLPAEDWFGDAHCLKLLHQANIMSMRRDLRPYWVKKIYLKFRWLYAEHFLRPAADYLGDHHTIMKPWYVAFDGPNIRVGKCATIIGERTKPVKLGVWGREEGAGSITVGDYVLMSPGTRLSASDDITIGDSVMMANSVYITDSDWHGIYDRTERSEKVTPVHIGDNVWLGDHCVVLKGVTIGENSVVAANAVVSKDVPANVVVAGNPAQVVKQLDPEQGFKTRADYFADPVALDQFFDAIEREVLGENGFFNWLRALLFPTPRD